MIVFLILAFTYKNPWGFILVDKLKKCIMHSVLCLPICCAITVLTTGAGHILPQDGTGLAMALLGCDLGMLWGIPRAPAYITTGRGCLKRNSFSVPAIHHEGCLDMKNANHWALGLHGLLSSSFVADHLSWLLNLSTVTKNYLPFSNFLEMLMSLCSNFAHFSSLRLCLSGKMCYFCLILNAIFL